MTTPDQYLSQLNENKNIFLHILDKINKLNLSTAKGDSVLYVIDDFFSKNKKQQQINLEEDKILDLLSKIGLFKILSIETDKVLRTTKNKRFKRIEPLARTYEIRIDRDKLNDLNNEFRSKNIERYSNVREEIRLKSYGIKIIGKNIYCKNIKNKKVFNQTEESLIYFLYIKHINNKDECFNIETLAKELNTSSGYLKNRIINIHKILGKVVSEITPPNIQFIKNEKGRGYHLNPKYFW